MTANSEEILSELNIGIAEYFKERLSTGKQLSASELGQIVRFLKNNDVRRAARNK
ncbi:MAG TPA: hypothetical protein VNH44_11185 [Micropepsaceae bacterium]|nr:hypothetical protein [Micropepsaceae bacterium]